MLWARGRPEQVSGSLGLDGLDFVPSEPPTLWALDLPELSLCCCSRKGSLPRISCPTHRPCPLPTS